MANAQNIFSGVVAQVAVHDATNGAMYLGYLAEDSWSFKQKELVHKDIGGLWYQYGTETTLALRLYETDPAKVANLLTRRSYKQSIYVTTANLGIKISNTYIQSTQIRGGIVDIIEVTAHTETESDVEIYKNLLSSIRDATDKGNFDTGAGPIADYWGELSTLTTKNLNAVSFLGAGYGGDQEIYGNMLGSDAGVYASVSWPVDQIVTMTGSVWAKYDSNYDNTFKIQIRTKNAGGSSLTIHESGEFEATASAARYSFTKEFLPDALTYYFSIYLIVEAGQKSNLRFDNAQLEFGSLSTYTEND